MLYLMNIGAKNLCSKCLNPFFIRMQQFLLLGTLCACSICPGFRTTSILLRMGYIRVPVSIIDNMAYIKVTIRITGPI